MILVEFFYLQLTLEMQSVRIAKVMIKNSNVVDFSFRAEDEYPVNFIQTT